MILRLQSGLRVFCIACLLALAALPARADFATWADQRLHEKAADMIDKLNADDRASLTSPEYQAVIFRKLTDDEAKQHTSACNDFKVGERLQFFVVDPNGKFYELPAQALTGPLNVWFEKWSVSSCGKPGFRSVMLIRDDKGKLKAIEMVPGATLGDPALQMDTIRIGRQAFVQPGCKEKPVFLDSKIIDDSRFVQHTWSEAWMVRGCAGEVLTRTVRYAPGGKGNESGTTIIVGDDTDTPPDTTAPQGSDK